MDTWIDRITFAKPREKEPFKTKFAREKLEYHVLQWYKSQERLKSIQPIYVWMEQGELMTLICDWNCLFVAVTG